MARQKKESSLSPSQALFVLQRAIADKKLSSADVRRYISHLGDEIRALEERRLGFAALDVTASEPLPPDSPLWRAPNCLITPHLSSATERLWERHFDLLSDNLRRYLAGGPLLNVVDKQAGY